MPIKWWIVLSTDWKLQNVQAGLVVVISIISFIAVWASARYFWHASAKRIVKNTDVPISSLLSFTTLGEVFDVIVLLKSKIFSSQHLSLTVQCLLVVIFSLCAIFAGPISRYATRVGSQDMLRPSKGLLASQTYNCDLNNVIKWHNVSESLNNADFPHDRLLDYLPDVKSNWVYHPEDWNSTYSAKCSTTSEANITLEALGVYTTGAYNVYDNIKGLSDVYSAHFLADGNNTNYQWWWSGSKDPKRDVWSHMVFYSYAEYHTDKDIKTIYDDKPTQHLSVHLSTIAMLDVPMTSDNSNIGKGKIPYAWYTKVECDITRNKAADRADLYEAFIDSSPTCRVPTNMDQYFSAPITQVNPDHSVNLNLPNGTELFRFYQAYTITKDTHFPINVIRKINLRVPTVELSTFFIAVMSLIILLVLIGLIHMTVYRFTYSHLYSRVPETKVDWLLQSLREAETAGLGHGATHSRATSTVSDDEYRSEKSSPRVAWEKARYSLAHPHASPAPSDGYTTPGGNRPPTGLGKVSIHRGDRTPSPAPPNLIPGPTGPPSFASFTNRNSGYNPLPNPEPYYGASSLRPPYPGASPAPSYNSPVSPDYSDRVMSYGVNSARMTPIINFAPRTEKGEWEVGVVEQRR